MNLFNNTTATCKALSYVNCCTILPSIKTKKLFFFTLGIWYAFSTYGRVEQDYVVVSYETSIVFRFLNFIYIKPLDEHETKLDTK